MCFEPELPPLASGPPAARTPGAELEATTIPQAFEQLARDTFRLTRTLVVLDSSGQLLGREVRTGLYRPDSGLQWLRVDRSGTFPTGSFDHAISRAERTPLAATQALWPDPLPFLQPRQRDAYRFRSLPDTVLFGRRVARLHVRPADRSAQGRTPSRACSTSMPGGSSVPVCRKHTRRSSARSVASWAYCCTRTTAGCSGSRCSWSSIRPAAHPIDSVWRRATFMARRRQPIAFRVSRPSANIRSRT
ncbi:hypothetical protein [Rhodothermus marinus]|uniref:hypothetical protein n=1 Tax=Rhodothermus marinus TaxID=29549 RepID=UPI001FB3D099|nr:hypothetical protein [Rhodothermus marinus]